MTWDGVGYGTDSGAVQHQLKNVQQSHSSNCVFAAIRGDGSVVTWGSADGGGDDTSVHDQLKNVQQIKASGDAFAAILVDGSVVAWVMLALVVTVVLSGIGWRTFSRSKHLTLLLLPFSATGLS